MLAERSDTRSDLGGDRRAERQLSNIHVALVQRGLRLLNLSCGKRLFFRTGADGPPLQRGGSRIAFAGERVESVGTCIAYGPRSGSGRGKLRVPVGSLLIGRNLGFRGREFGLAGTNG